MSQNDEKDDFLSVRQLAERWSMAPLTIRRMIYSGKLPAYRIQTSGTQPSVRIKLSDVIDHEENR